ncbi:OmpA family protein [Azomonas macrocytogenes]|uniref:Outer membrane protein OmpA-like peptidoglycan-associated protein n=1 Tax=Azomonas macrocytogenes TaxID=69962 RepID=A0A839SXY9_AZOMA|nr:OmpA family protein [Azomonas macrocytogenes]MBB3101982.1 outer membrane protein OmpA-like peptidoglycan-associated protein [Azomonas macrocytogenes]
MNRVIAIPTLLALSIGLAACSSQPNANLEEARNSFYALQNDPRASQLAALETQDASKQLDLANQAYLEDASEEKVDQLAYVTKRRVELAEQTIAFRTAEQELQQTDAQRTEARLQARDAQIKKLQQELQGKQTERGTLVTFGDVLFDYNRAELKPGGLRNVQKLADFLNQDQERQVIAEGYTDSTGGDAYNQQLSERRAESVRVALIKMGVDPRRVVTQGYGKQYPVASNSTNSGRALNRRVEVTISNDNQPVAPRSSIR